MAEFAEVIKQAQRMCNEMSCEDCPLEDVLEACPIGDTSFNAGLASMEKLVMDWAAQNPEPKYPTWFCWQNDVFRNHGLEICPKSFGVDCPYNNVPTGHECDICRNRPIPAYIAEKLGVKPIGGRDE